MIHGIGSRSRWLAIESIDVPGDRAECNELPEYKRSRERSQASLRFCEDIKLGR